ncbi:MAG: TRAP transporter large permease [Planctomycetaceae bacterium]|nr:TRAP transporter large permease [Planctomycetaceae bacterium]
MLALTLTSLLVFVALGVPVSFGIGLSGLIGIYFGSNVPGFVVVQQMVRGMNSFPLMAAPMFILAGAILGEAGLSDRILRFCRALFSWAKGGMGMVCVLANMIFAGISGSGAATMCAVGTLTVPGLVKAGYSRSFIASLIAGSGSLGPIIPPSVNMIIYGSLTGFSVGKLFIGGLIPGIIIGLGLMIMCNIYAVKHGIDSGGGALMLEELWDSFKAAFFALIAPLIIVGGVVTGIFTATESGIIACLYGFFCGIFIYRTVKLQQIYNIMKQAAESSGMLLMIMGISSIYSYIFAKEKMGEIINNLLLSISTDPTTIVVIIICIMLIIGCFMETIAAMVVILPIVYPIIISLGIDPLMFGVLFSISTVVGGLTPPVGLYLFLSMDIAKAPFHEAVRYVGVVTGIVLFVMLLGLFFPAIITYVPGILM